MANEKPEFVFAKGLPTEKRIAVVLALATVGFLLQVFVSVFLGWLFVFTVVLVGGVRGKSNRPILKSDSDWKNVTIAEMEEAQELLEKTRKWMRETGAYSLGTPMGCATFLLTAASIIVVTIILYLAIDANSELTSPLAPIMKGGSIAAVFALDSFTLLLPLWIFGRVRTWYPPNIDIRIKQLKYIYESAHNDPLIDFQPSLQVAKTEGGAVPLDCRLMAKIRDSDPNFLGVQVQVSLNEVQGRTYPYTYCVLIAKPEFDLQNKARALKEPVPGGFLAGLFADENAKKETRFPRYREMVMEVKAQNDVEIAVIRQPTSGTGYRTSEEEALKVFMTALTLAKTVLGKS